MFIGHHAVGFGSKKYAPRASMGALLLAPMLLDVLWPIFLLLGIEHFRIDPGNTAVTPLDFYDYPWSHSLLMAVVWSVVAGIGYYAATKYKRGAVVVGLGVVSHWFFDFLTHRPDLPLYPGGPKVGLGLWNSLAGTAIVETLLFALGIYLYVTVTKARDRIGSIGFWSLIAVLMLIYVANLMGPPPPKEDVVAWMALLALLFPLWAWWADRHRTVR
jgi:membrane-bound metal-dependent hydrolase YbcI (DUF457 family)